jgi:hypothetical protein
MGRNALFFLAGLLCSLTGEAQELFVFTEPASNMAAHSIGLRLNNTLYRMEGSTAYAYRLEPELMWGASKHLMVHAAVYASDMYQPSFKAEGGSLYAKYRIYAADEVHRHFRLAAFVKAALVGNPGLPETGVSHAYKSDEIDLNGNNSGFLAGLVGTQLIHKVAFSGSVAYAQRWDNVTDAHGVPGQSGNALNYSASAGWLLFPRHYRDYRQTNMNLMCEFLGASALDKRAAFVDVAPAVQFIFNSISRLDLGYRTQVAGDMDRLSRSAFFVRLEYNFLNAYR